MSSAASTRTHLTTSTANGRGQTLHSPTLDDLLLLDLLVSTRRHTRGTVERDMSPNINLERNKTPQVTPRVRNNPISLCLQAPNKVSSSTSKGFPFCPHPRRKKRRQSTIHCSITTRLPTSIEFLPPPLNTTTTTRGGRRRGSYGDSLCRDISSLDDSIMTQVFRFNRNRDRKKTMVEKTKDKIDDEKQGYSCSCSSCIDVLSYSKEVIQHQKTGDDLSDPSERIRKVKRTSKKTSETSRSPKQDAERMESIYEYISCSCSYCGSQSITDTEFRESPSSSSSDYCSYEKVCVCCEGDRRRPFGLPYGTFDERAKKEADARLEFWREARRELPPGFTSSLGEAIGQKFKKRGIGALQKIFSNGKK